MAVIVCVQTGGMPAPEQSPVTEEGLLFAIRDGSTGRKMEAENTANNILASVKEQVVCSDHGTHLLYWYSCLNSVNNWKLILIHTWNYNIHIYLLWDKYSKSTPILWPFFPFLSNRLLSYSAHSTKQYCFFLIVHVCRGTEVRMTFFFNGTTCINGEPGKNACTGGLLAYGWACPLTHSINGCSCDSSTNTPLLFNLHAYTHPRASLLSFSMSLGSTKGSFLCGS